MYSFNVFLNCPDVNFYKLCFDNFTNAQNVFEKLGENFENSPSPINKSKTWDYY